ncbi:PIN domain-like protein [Xylariaceae sp. FL0594]|nr:PIN domain-like protein [Xylariaceae sp. FL0594]
MGVNGLWTVIQPCARPTNLATLNRKRLAVDASIWIYQFLKAVRDKEGNALRNSHVVGFFRRICKLLWFGILPVFVFDGGAPALKRQTITNRKRRREGRREDAVRTAGKLLAVQMQRIAEDEGEKRRRRLALESEGREKEEEPREHAVEEEIPDVDKLVYVEELGMSQQERQKSRKFYKQDAYHLPDLDGGIENMGRPEDPRIMSVQELEEYARQFQSGEDINLYDFSKIDFEGEFFKSLPPADRYNILNAARLRSRLRMGLSKDQLDNMFPDRMAFSRFQIERVRERNHLTQRLMKEAGMTGTDLTIAVNARIAGEKDREYILVKNEGAEGGWALGVVSREKDRGEIHKPIDVDALDLQYQAKEEETESEEEEFEDVPIEGLNRLPKLQRPIQTQGPPDTDLAADNRDEDSLFVGGDDVEDGMDGLLGDRANEDSLFQDEEEDLNRAIALSLRNQHGLGSPSERQEEVDGELDDAPAPEWTQKAVEGPKPVTATRGSIIAHIVNNRANAAVPKRRESGASSDSDVDFRSALAAAKKQKQTVSKPKPNFKPTATAAAAVPNQKNPFDGPLPFQKLDWKSSIFSSQKQAQEPVPDTLHGDSNMDGEDTAGGFLAEAEDDDKARPLPPWMIQDESDIRSSVKAQQVLEKELNQADLEAAAEEERQRRKDAIIEIESSDSDSDGDVQIVDAPPHSGRVSPVKEGQGETSPGLGPATLARVDTPTELVPQPEDTRQAPTFPEQRSAEARGHATTSSPQPEDSQSSPEPEFEEVEIVQPPKELQEATTAQVDIVPDPENIPGIDVALEHTPVGEAQVGSSEVPADVNRPALADDEFDDDFSDPEEEQLLAQMAEEAEEHARFASQLNNKSERENQEAYERELKALRIQQKKDRRDADEVTQIMITECQALLRYFGIPYITAPMEAEAQCAELVNLGLVDGIVTDDSDIFLFGGTRVYKNMFNSNKFVECYLASDLERELSLSREQLIALAQLLGSDYTEGLPGIGPVTAVEILSEFPGKDGLEQFRDWWQQQQQQPQPHRDNKDKESSIFRKKFRKSHTTKLFLPPGFPSPAVAEAYLRPAVDHSAEPFRWGAPDVEGLRGYLMATIGWSQERTDEVLVPVIRDMNRREAEGTQSNITRYFEGSVGVGAKVKEAFAPRQRGRGSGSKRMAQAVDRLRAHAVGSGSGSGSGASATATEGEENHQEDETTLVTNSAANASSGRKRKARNTNPTNVDADVVNVDVDGAATVTDEDEEAEEEEESDAQAGKRRKGDDAEDEDEGQDEDDDGVDLEAGGLVRVEAEHGAAAAAGAGGPRAAGPHVRDLLLLVGGGAAADGGPGASRRRRGGGTAGARAGRAGGDGGGGAGGRL